MGPLGVMGLGLGLAGMTPGGGGVPLVPLASVSLDVMANPPVVTQLTQASPTLVTGDRTQYAATNAVHRYLGVPTINHPTLGVGYQIPSLNSGSQAGAAWMTYEWQSNSSFVELRTICSNAQFQITVDGEVIRSTQFANDASGSVQYIDIDWSTNPTPNKSRHYRVSGFNFAFGGIFIKHDGNTSTATFPSQFDARELMVWIGDSYVQGTGAQVDRRHVAPLVSRYLGFDHWHDGIGSTHWASTSTNAPTTRNTNYLKRASKKLVSGSKSPKIIVSSLGYNQHASPSGVDAGYDAWVADIKAAYPTAQIVTLGPWWPNIPTDRSGLIAVGQRLQARAAAAGAQYVDLADVAFSVGGDDTHPTSTGHAQLALAIANKINALPSIQTLRLAA